MNVKKIISIEPSPTNYLRLKHNKEHYIKKFNKTDIIIEKIGLGSENKQINVKQFEESSSSTMKSIDEKSSYFKKKFNLLNFFNKKKYIKS